MSQGAAAAMAETHSAVLVFLGDRAYKVKKPVDLGFLDFRTLEARASACHREVELNRRLAPDVYLGVADVIGPSGEVCDHLVVMRRMPEDRRLAHLVVTGEPVAGHLAQLAELIAAFHAEAERSPEADRAAGRDALAARWAANTRHLLDHTGGGIDAGLARQVDELARRYLDGRGPLFALRIEAGRACDGHGDLLADDIFCLDDGVRVLDCIEFDDALRHGDTLADVAFLAMDLERLGRRDLGERFLRQYATHAGDTWPRSLAHHHIAYRAQVRAKVAAIRADQGDGGATAEATRLLELAEHHLQQGRVRIVVVGGLPGTGKSTLAAGLAERLGATVLRSDAVRKELAGLAPLEAAPAALGEGLYTPAATEVTYRTLLERAAVAASLGGSVVLDASWHHPRWRAAARQLAAEASADLSELRCTAPPDVAAARMAARAAAGGDPSDATPEVAAAMAATASPWSTAADVDTGGDATRALVQALAQVEA